MKADEVPLAKSQPNSQKVLQKKERKPKIESFAETQPEHNDSFEKFYNKDLDLEEGKNFYPLIRCLNAD
jgi:hypothetical protein